MRAHILRKSGAGLAGPSHRAGQDDGEGPASQPAADRNAYVAPSLGEGDVSSARVLSWARPCGLAVPDEHDLAHRGTV